MIISPKNKFIFFKPMKCAGSSVELSLLKGCGDEALCTGTDNIEEELQGYIKLNNEYVEEGIEKFRFHSHTWPSLFFERISNSDLWNDFKKITIVRNPWDTVVSWYWWSICRSYGWSDEMIIRKSDSQSVASQKFEKFLFFHTDHEAIRPGSSSSIKCTPLDYISQNERFIDSRVDRFIFFENIQEEYNSLCLDLNMLPSSLTKLKSTQRKLDNHYRYYYNKSTKNAVSGKFLKTIEKFKYNF